MLALIKREIEDHLVWFILGAVMTAFFAFMTVCNVAFQRHKIPPTGIPLLMVTVFMTWYMPLLFLLSAVLGATQMYSDLSQKKSSFLATLATTRRRIFFAKIIAGLLWVLMCLLPIVAVDVVLLSFRQRLAPIDMNFPAKILITTFLATLCCYMLGLQMGRQTNKRSAILGSIILVSLFLSVIIIKGLGVQTVIILALFAITMFVRTWQRFMSTSL